jgi:hypothetical protein
MCFVSKLKSALKGGFFILYARLGDVETAENDSEKQKEPENDLKPVGYQSL